ncbi:MAG: DUF4433 domain-containing protein [Chloroflexi bacterium]|nr:DUF4433 domain-containing protein [Chloroflexota bacterium]
MATSTPQFLYYITHIDNLQSMLEKGILSHAEMESKQLAFTPIYDEQIVTNRKARLTPDGRSLWDYANVYFQARNAMLFRVAREKGVDEICIIGVRKDILNRHDVFIANGNAASYQSEIIAHNDGVRSVPQIMRNVDKEWWSDSDGSKREMMAECLVPTVIPPDFITAVYVGSEAAQRRAQAVAGSIPVTREPHLFFKPRRTIELTPLITLGDGDLFFSGMQTLTVSVNTVGVMGKGLASTAKWRFPDVYVRYQDLCRRKTLRMGRPVVVKREKSLDEELADDPRTMLNGNHETWFLLFATKDHWRNNANLAGIEQGLLWLRENYKSEGIQSLALPALGCGLGNLRWHDVGPLMCSYLNDTDLRTWISLPSRSEPPADELTREFLLSKGPTQGQANLGL